jgi:hypothetical protein
MIHEMVFDPRELTDLGQVFDETWNALIAEHPAFAIRPEMRLRLASVVLHLARDHQLGRHQIKATALRLVTHGDAAFVVTS